MHPGVYAKMLGERIARHGAKVWLVNTGWTGGPYGTGSRMKLAHTRAMVRAALAGALDGATFTKDPSSASRCPTAVPDVPPACSTPRATWKDPAAYDAQARDWRDVPRELRAVPAAGVRGGRGGGTGAEAASTGA